MSDEKQWKEFWIKHCDFYPDQAFEDKAWANCGAGCKHTPTHVIEYAAVEELQREVVQLISDRAWFKERCMRLEFEELDVETWRDQATRLSEAISWALKQDRGSTNALNCLIVANHEFAAFRERVGK